MCHDRDSFPEGHLLARTRKCIVADTEACGADDLERELRMPESTSSHRWYNYGYPHCERKVNDIIALKLIAPL